MSVESDAIDDWKGDLSVNIFPLDPMKLDCSQDLIHLHRSFAAYPLAVERTKPEKPVQYEPVEKYEIVWDDTGESILPIVELSDDQ